MKYFSFIITVFCLSFNTINAQCTVEQIQDTDTAYKGNNLRFGQTFTSCQDGVITSLGFLNAERAGDPSTFLGDYELYIAQQNTGVNIPGVPYEIFTVSSIGFQSVTLSTPFPVSDGLEYEFQVVPTDPMGYNSVEVENGDPYGGGACTVEGVGLIGNLDLIFEVNIEPAIPIPTLSQWGIIFLSILTMIIGVVVIRQRKMTFV